MDYIHLKKTLIAVFDHFLSCHDMHELEEMMQAFEAGKSIVIKLPEAVHRDDYIDDVLAREDKQDDVLAREDKQDDMKCMKAALKPKKIVSRIRRKKPKPAGKCGLKQIKICDVPVLMDLTKLSEEKRDALKDTLNGNHKVTFNDVMANDRHGFAKATVFKVVREEEGASSHEGLLSMARYRLPISQHSNPLVGKDQKDKSDRSFFYYGLSAGERAVLQKTQEAHSEYSKENVQNMILDIKKYCDPP